MNKKKREKRTTTYGLRVLGKRKRGSILKMQPMLRHLARFITNTLCACCCDSLLEKKKIGEDITRIPSRGRLSNFYQRKIKSNKPTKS